MRTGNLGLVIASLATVSRRFAWIEIDVEPFQSTHSLHMLLSLRVVTEGSYRGRVSGGRIETKRVPNASAS